jgi:hypothetical protein
MPETKDSLLEVAGFVNIDELDVTDAFIETTKAWIEERAALRHELALLDAPGAFDQR